MASDISPLPETAVELNYDSRSLLVLRIGVCACFAGWAWQHLRWSAPYGSVLWDPDYFGWLADWLEVPWESYVADYVTDGRIGMATRFLGVLYLGISLNALFTKRDSVLSQIPLVLGSGLLATLAFCKYVHDGHASATFVEHGGQILSPILLTVALRRGTHDRWTIATAVVAFWTTFAGHGYYALGLAPTPGHFYGMVHAILGLGESASESLLRMAGVLDFAVCLGILLPLTRRPCLVYATLWGTLTALARPVAGMAFESNWWGADQFLHEAILRIPHAAVPLFLFLVSKDRKDVPATPDPLLLSSPAPSKKRNGAAISVGSRQLVTWHAN